MIFYGIETNGRDGNCTSLRSWALVKIYIIDEQFLFFICLVAVVLIALTALHINRSFIQ